MRVDEKMMEIVKHARKMNLYREMNLISLAEFEYNIIEKITKEIEDETSGDYCSDSGCSGDSEDDSREKEV